MSAPFYEDEIAQLRTGMASGEVTIESNGDRITYRSIAEIRSALSYFEGMAAAAAGASVPSVTLAAFSRD